MPTDTPSGLPPEPPVAFELDLGRVTDATARLVLAVDDLDAAALAGPSLLPGWSRAHVVAHVARNAEGMLNLVDWALTGQPCPMYPSADARADGIESAAALPPVALRDLLLESATRLAEACVRLRDGAPAARSRLVLFGPPRADAVADTPAEELAWARLREVEIHHLDLDAGYGPGDWPEDFVARMTAYLDSRGPAPAVVGDPAAVVAWRLGRGRPGAVSAPDGGPVGEPPAW